MATNQLNGFLRCLRTTMLLQEASGVTDAQLLESFITRKDEAAFEALVRRHSPMVWGVCCRVLGHVQDAEDAFQATFLVLVRRAASVVPRGMVGNWLHGVAYRTAMKARAAATKRRMKEKQVEVLPEPQAAQHNRLHDLVPLLDQELDRLPDKYRVAVILCDLEGKTHREAARQLDWPVGTLSTRLLRARVMLAKRLTRHGLAITSGALVAVLTQNARAACVPTPLLFSTIKAATLFAAGQTATAGLISVKVAALTEGVLKTMLLTKLKVAVAVVLVVGLISTSATGLVYYAKAGEQPDHEQQQSVKSDLPAKESEAKVLDLGQQNVELERLRAEIEALKKHLRQLEEKLHRGEAEKAAEVRFLQNESDDLEFPNW
jgi:RNA polymerase sigma factor (sigma-70 family)